MIEMDEAMQSWIESHKNDDIARLLLKHRGDERIAQAIVQIECRRKAATKIPGMLANKGFMFPHVLSAEQCTSEPLAKFHAELADDAATVLDMTAGLGIDAMTLAADRRRSVTAVDINADAAHALTHNASLLGLDNLKAVCADSTELLADYEDGSLDLIFIDPARRSAGGGRLKALADCEPDVTRLLPLMLKKSRRVIIKASPMLDIEHTVAELNEAANGKGAVSRIMSVGTKRECKEVVAEVTAGADPKAEPAVEAVTIDGDRRIIANVGHCSETPVASEAPEAGMYLYEPYPAVMKMAGRLNPAAGYDDMEKLAPATHLYVSPVAHDDFAGEMMRIERIEGFSDKSAKALGREYPMVNVTTRNFIISAPELAKRLRVKEGGEKRIYGVRVGEGRGKLMLIATSAPIV